MAKENFIAGMEFSIQFHTVDYKYSRAITKMPLGFTYSTVKREL